MRLVTGRNAVSHPFPAFFCERRKCPVQFRTQAKTTYCAWLSILSTPAALVLNIHSACLSLLFCYRESILENEYLIEFESKIKNVAVIL
jgi:hypothetical protein